MSLFKPDAPAPPNPIATSAAQTGTNVSTGVANAFLNNVNQITPGGSLNYDATGSYDWRDPVSGLTYTIPRFTATQILSPDSQQIQQNSTGAQINLSELAKTRSADLNRMLGSGIDISGAPAAGNPQFLHDVGDPATGFADVGHQQGYLNGTGQQQGQYAFAGDVAGEFADTGHQQGQFADVGGPTRSYGPQDNFSADRGRVEEALYGRLNPQLDRERANLEQRLADQGIRYGSEAYHNAMDDYSRQANDARLAVTQTAGQEQQRMMDMAAQRAGFENAAQMQAYTQAKGRGEFANTAQQTEYLQAQGRGVFKNMAQKQAADEAQARGDFANKAQAQQFQEELQTGTFRNQAQKDEFQQEATRGEFSNAALAQQMQQRQQKLAAQNTARNSWLAEQFQMRNQPINEISALLSGSQVSGPNFVNTPTNNIANTDVAGIINNRFTQDLDVYKQQSANFNSLMGGIFGMMAGVNKSDRREKENIEKVGTVFAAGPDGERDLPIYEFDYKRDDPDSARHVGPMAQDVEKIDKQSVKTIGGVKHIDMTRMGSIMRLKKAA